MIADPTPLVVVDVHYRADEAVAACAVAARWSDETPIEERIATTKIEARYEPGRFYLRELPPILSVLELVQSSFEAVVIDGYVDLDAGKAGLGAHLHEKIGGVVIGVAKTAFRGSTFAATVLRGASRRPLFVTARGVAIADAARLVRHMHGAYRIPSMLRHVDRLARLPKEGCG